MQAKGAADTWEILFSCLNAGVKEDRQTTQIFLKGSVPIPHVLAIAEVRHGKAQHYWGRWVILPQMG